MRLFENMKERIRANSGDQWDYVLEQYMQSFDLYKSSWESYLHACVYCGAK